MTVLAIDQGTSGTKAMVHDGERVLAVVERPLRPRYLADGGVEIDPIEMWTSVMDAAEAALDAAGRPSLSLVSLANQGESVLAWDRRDGRPLSPVVVWQDRRAEEICRDLDGRAECVAQRTGLLLSAYFSAPKMAWIRRHLTRAGVVTTTDAWLVARLTGAFVTDATTASRSLLMDLDTLAWDHDLCEVFGWSDEELPGIVRNDEVVGGTSVFGAEVAVGGLIVDQQAALAAQGCLAPGDAKCTYGTGAFLLANTGPHPTRPENGLTSSLAWLLAHERAYCVDAQAYTMGSALRWLTSLGALSGPAQLDEECSDTSGGVVFVPALAGMASPWWTTAPQGALLGMGLATERGNVLRAVVEGLASQVAVLARAVADEIGTPLTRLRVDGGLTRSRALMQAQADLLQLPVDCFPSPHATALGAVTTARLTEDSHLTLAEAAPAWAPKETFEPRWSESRATETLSRWEEAVTQVLVGC